MWWVVILWNFLDLSDVRFVVVIWVWWVSCLLVILRLCWVLLIMLL